MLGIYGTVYNSADTVRQTIEDLKSKLKEDFIIVVTDNFSTDGTYEILKEYDFVDVIRMKCTRGMGRQKALEHLIKNYKEVDFIFYIDFDLSFPHYFYHVIKNIKNINMENTFWTSIISCMHALASYETYKEAIKKTRWPNANIGEDSRWMFDLLRSGFMENILLFPLSFNQIRRNRERKYLKKNTNLNYIYRYVVKGILIDLLIKTKLYMTIKRIINPNFNFNYREKLKYIFPEDIGIDPEYFFLIIRAKIGKLPEDIKKILKLKGKSYNFITFKGKNIINRYFIIYRNYKKVEKLIEPLTSN